MVCRGEQGVESGIGAKMGGANYLVGRMSCSKWKWVVSVKIVGEKEYWEVRMEQDEEGEEREEEERGELF